FVRKTVQNHKELEKRDRRAPSRGFSSLRPCSLGFPTTSGIHTETSGGCGRLVVPRDFIVQRRAEDIPIYSPRELSACDLAACQISHKNLCTNGWANTFSTKLHKRDHF